MSEAQGRYAVHPALWRRHERDAIQAASGINPRVRLGDEPRFSDSDAPELQERCGCGDAYPEGSEEAEFIGRHGHCPSCEMAEGEQESVSAHYRHSVRVPVTAEDLERGYAVFKLDPCRVCDVYATGGGPREQMIKKLLRWTDKDQNEGQVLREIGAALDRWHEMRAEDAEVAMPRGCKW